MSDAAATPAATPSAPATSAPSSTSRAASRATSGAPSSNQGTASSVGRMRSSDMLRAAQLGKDLSVPAPAKSAPEPVSDSDPTEPALELDTDSAPAETSDETPWYERHAKVHDLDASEILAALSEGRLPEQLFDKLKLTMQDGEFEWEDSVAKLREGAMLRSNYTKKTQELAREREVAHAQMASIAEELNSWKGDPKLMINGMRRLGFPIEDALYVVVQELAHREALNKQSPGSGDQWLEAVRKQAEYEQVQAMQARLNQAAQKKQQERVVQDIRRTAVEEMTRIGGQWDDATWNEFSRLAEAHHDETGSEPDEAAVRRLVRKAKAQVADWVIDSKTAASARPIGQKTSISQNAAPMAGGAPRNTVPTSPKAKRLTSDQALLAILGGRR